MKAIDTAAGVVFLISGGLVSAFGVFSILGTGVSAMIAAIGVAEGTEEALLGLLMLVLYATFMVVGLLAGPLQLAAGVQLLRGKKGLLTWVGAFSGLASVITVYCAVPGMIAFALGLVVMLTPDQPAPAPRLAGSPVRATGGGLPARGREAPPEPFDPPNS